MANSIRALLIKRNKKNNSLIIEDMVFIDTLDNLYKLLECELIEIQERLINGKLYDFIFDEEYLLNGKSQEPTNAVAFGIDDKGTIQKKGDILEVIFGNLIICGIANDKGEETSLNEEDIKAIYKSQAIAKTTKGEQLNIIKYTFD